MNIFPKLSFGSSLIAFALPFLLVTCNDKKTVELKPLVMQDQFIYPLQEYKLITNSLDKNLEEATAESDSFNPFGGAPKDFLSEPSEDSISWIQVFLVLCMLAALAGLIMQFTIRARPQLQRFSIYSAALGLLFLLLFFISVEVGLNKINDKMKGGLGGGGLMGNIEYMMGFGSGFYLYLGSMAAVLVFYLWFDRNYSVVPRNIDEDPRLRTLTEREQPVEEETISVRIKEDKEDLSRWAPPSS